MHAFEDVCRPESAATMWVVFGGVLVLWGLLMFLFGRRPGKRKAAAVGFVVLALPILAVIGFSTVSAASRFTGYAVGPDTVTLRFAWPRGDIAVSRSGLQLSVLREQTVTHGKSHAGVWEQGWMVIRADGEVRRSCTSSNFERLVGSAKAIGAAAKVEPVWSVRCGSGAEVNVTEAVAGAPGDQATTDFQGLCGSSKSASDVR